MREAPVPASQGLVEQSQIPRLVEQSQIQTNRWSLFVCPGTKTSEAGKGREGSVAGSLARIVGGGGGGVFVAAERLLGLGRTARGGEEANDDADDADADDEEETTSLALLSSLSSDDDEGFADALAKRIDL